MLNKKLLIGAAVTDCSLVSVGFVALLIVSLFEELYWQIGVGFFIVIFLSWIVGRFVLDPVYRILEGRGKHGDI